ncbi:MAG: 23S ribosomal protein [Ignavibacteria bacterium]|nr:MAG: 23S ribosomal protein [Ignavibacteria bacterium]KAF0161104.1 MAG: 23S ribosomal protein [Ignavibacteria bacterium]
MIWQKSRELVKIVYSLTEKLPSEEKFGLTNQMRRASVSIVSNIAEGSGKESEKEFLRFIETAYSSAFELETQLILAVDLGMLGNESQSAFDLIQEIQKMIYSFSKSIKEKIK